MSNTKKLYWISFFHSLVPAYVIERLFWQQRGMNVQMVVYAEIVYALTVTIFEVPSGILADKYGRKRMLSLNSFLSAIEMLLLLFAHDFWQFALAVFLAGVGKALSSGSENALLYDSLLAEGRQDDFEKLLGRISAFDITGSIIAALSGGVLANHFNYEFNYFLSVISMGTAFVVTLLLEEPPKLKKQETEIIGAARYAKQALTVFIRQPLVLIYCLTGAVLGACVIYLDEFWQTALDYIGIPVVFFGAVGALASMLRLPGNLFAFKLKGRFEYRHIFVCVITVSIVGYAAIFFLENALCLIPMMLMVLVNGVVDPLVSGYLHHNTESNIRATAESFTSLGLRILSIGVGLVFGYVSMKYSIFTAFLSLGVVCLTYLPVYIVKGKADR